MDIQTCLEQIFKQFEFPVKGWQCHCEGFGQFRDSMKVAVEIGRITISRQLLKGAQNLVRFNCRRGVLTAKLWLTCGARLILFS